MAVSSRSQKRGPQTIISYRLASDLALRFPFQPPMPAGSQTEAAAYDVPSGGCAPLPIS
jgi:hypothetical protein